MSRSPQNVVVILQARTGSRRLPGKVLRGLAGRSLVTHCRERLLAARGGSVVLATTTESTDDVLADLAQGLDVPVVRGSEPDVLGRFALVANRFPAHVVLRATGDNPAVDSEVPARLLTALASSSCDYVAEDGLPYGAGLEVFRREVLMQAHAEAQHPDDREHVTTWVKRNTRRYHVRLVPPPAPIRRPDLRFTIDTPGDLAYMRRVFEAAGAGERIVPLADIIRAADECAQIAEVA